MAQSGPRYAGRVLTDTNAPLANVRVFLTCGGAPIQQLTPPGGAFAFDAPPGACRISAEAEGYFPLKDKPVEASTDIRLILNPRRELLEALDVSAEPVAVDLETVSTEQRATGADLVNVPYPSTNNLHNALRIVPGVLPDNRGGLHVNGGAAEQTLYTLDGFNLSDPLTGRFETRLSVEAVQAVEIVSGPVNPQFGKGSAGTLSLRPRTGGDKFRSSATNFIPGIENRKGLIIGNFTPRVNFSGPWRRGRAWWSNSTDLQYDQTVILEQPSGADRSHSTRWSNLFHNQVNLRPSNILYGTALATWWSAPRQGLSPLSPMETTIDRRARQVFVSIRNQAYIGGGGLIEVGYARNRTWTREIPQGPGPLLFTPAGQRGNWWRDAAGWSGRHQFLANGFLPTLAWRGSHLVKLGIDLNRLHYAQEVRRTSFANLRDDGSLLRRTSFLGSGDLRRSNTELGWYLQDSWRVKPNFQVEGGFRWDWDQIIRRVSFAPRIAAAWSPKERPNTKFSGGAGVIFDATNLLLFIRPDDQVAVNTYYHPDGAILRGPALSFFRAADERLRPPGIWSWSAGWEQRFLPSWSLKVNYLGKRGLRGLTYLDKFEAGELNPFPQYPVDAFYRLVNQRQDRFDSVEVAVRQTLRRQYEWMASYIRSSARSNASVDLSIDEPQIVPDNSGPLPWDAPHRIVSWGYLPAVWKNWAIAYLVDWRSGFPFSVLGEDGRVIGAVNSRRFPVFFETNLHLEWRLSRFGHRWALRGGVNNLNNRRNPTVVNNMSGSPQFLTYQGGFGRALNFRIRWLGRL